MLEVSIFNPPISNIYSKESIPFLAVLISITRGIWGTPHKSLKDITEAYRLLEDATEKSEYKKTHFPGFTPSGIFHKRLDHELIKHSGVVHVDVDGLDEQQFAKVQQTLRKIENSLIAYCI